MSKGGMSDNASQLSDMSYQSDLSGISKAFITSAKTKLAKKPKLSEKEERPKSAERETPKFEPVLEHIGEGGHALFYRCPSPKIKPDNTLAVDAKPDECDERLDVYLEEVQQYLDYINDLEDNIKDQRDLKIMGEMSSVCDKAVKEHIEVCDQLIVDVAKCSLMAEEEIRKSKKLGITYDDPNKVFQYNEQGLALVHSIKNRDLVRIQEEEEEKEEKQESIQSAKQQPPS